MCVCGLYVEVNMYIVLCEVNLVDLSQSYLHTLFNQNQAPLMTRPV